VELSLPPDSLRRVASLEEDAVRPAGIDAGKANATSSQPITLRPLDSAVNLNTARGSVSVMTKFPTRRAYREYCRVMLHDFLSANRSELIARCRTKVRVRSRERRHELTHGITLFLDQLIKALQIEQTSEPMQSRRISGPAGGYAAPSIMGDSAVLHARELLRNGYTVDEVVHDYGDLCQAVTDMAFEQGAAIGADEFRTMNRCLDNVIAVAVTEYAYQRDSVSAERHAADLAERLGFLAHELRNHLTTATLSFALIQSGKVAVTGSTGAVLNRSLVGLRSLIDRSLADVRIAAGLPMAADVFPLDTFIAEISLSAALEAEIRGCVLITPRTAPDLAISGDRDMLMAAVGNLLQNAFKFTRPGTEVTLHAYANADRVHIDAADHCGGLAAGVPESMFEPYVQGGSDRSGLGLGLSIAKRSVEAHAGTLSVRNIPHTGCVLTVNLPRHALPIRGDALEPAIPA
jgi:signal transduction histidine kinase